MQKSRSGYRWCALLLALGVSLVLSSCNSNEVELGSLEIKVIDANKNPVPAVTVTPSGDLGTLVTDAEGRTAWDKVPAGEYSATVTKDTLRVITNFPVSRDLRTSVTVAF